MKKFIEKNKLLILSIIILFGWGIYEMISTCIYDPGGASFNRDPLIIYFDYFQQSLYNLCLVVPLFVFIPAIHKFHSELSSKHIKNCLTRMTYKEYLIKNYLHCLKYALILPIFVIFLMLGSCIIAGGFNFGSGTELGLYGWLSAAPDIKYLDILGEFMFTYVFNIFLHSIIYINLGLFFCKKNSNFLVNIILSYIGYIVLCIITELGGGLLFGRILKIHGITDTLNLFNIWIYDNVISLPAITSYSALLVIITTIIVYLIYRDKEGVLIEVEK